MAILAVFIGSLCVFVWHGLIAYPTCSRSEAVRSREDAIAHSISIWDDETRKSLSIEDYESRFVEMIKSEDFHRPSSGNWHVTAEPIFLGNRAWHVRYWDFNQHISAVTDFDQCKKPVKEEYYQVYDTISRYAF